MLNTQDRIDLFIHKEYKKDLINCSIIKEGRSILLFNRYKISPTNIGYKVDMLRSSSNITFFDIKNALTYCIFENYQNYSEANHVVNLDRIINNYEFNVKLQQKMINNKISKDQKTIHLSKLLENLSKKKQAKEQMDKLINISRTLLLNKFNSSLKSKDFDK